MSENQDNTIKKALDAALNTYRETIRRMDEDEWNGILNDMRFSPADPAWPEWDERDNAIREEMDFIESLSDDDENIYITLSYVDDNELNKVTGITATDGNCNVLLDINFIIPIDLDTPILEQFKEAT